jgi:chemotaxis signal transduction protein
VIIVQIGSNQVGRLANRVLDIVCFDVSSIQPVHHLTHTSGVSFLPGVVAIEAP